MSKQESIEKSPISDMTSQFQDGHNVISRRKVLPSSEFLPWIKTEWMPGIHAAASAI